jgi:hypothetical protein
VKKYVFLRFPDFKDKAVTLSYDDGVVYDKKLIDIMNANGLKGTFNLNSGLFAAKSGERRLTKEEALELYAHSGHEVAVHGVKHLSLAEVDKAMAANDILQDRIALENMFGRVIKGMAYANGSLDQNVADIMKTCGIEYARTTVSAEKFDIPENWLMMPATCDHKNPRLMELAHEFIEKQNSQYYWSNTPRLFHLWGHSYEFNDEDNWQIIEDFAKYIGNREDIWYATNGEIFEYVKAYESLRFSADGNMIHNPSCTPVYLNYFGKQYKISPGQTIIQSK